MHFVAKLFPEITIKSRPVRRRLVRQLRRNLRTLLRDIDNDIEVIGEWDAIDIKPGLSDTPSLLRIEERLRNTPGIALVQEVEQYPLEDLESIAGYCKACYGQLLTGKTFAVRCKRNGKHPFTSVDVERYVGGELLGLGGATGVNLKHPDVTVRLEVRGEYLYLVKQQYAGLGGFPLGTQEAVLSLISGGFDSAVSSYLCIRRGLLTHYCFFNLGGKAHEFAVKELALFLWMRFSGSHRVNFVTVPFEGVVAEILTRVDNAQMGVVLKRMMLRAASRIADQLQVSALVTGESVAQVSSQTLPNLTVIDAVCDKLVLRPLITSDKQEIIDTARRIGTEEFSRNIPEYCGVISVKPTTRARPERIAREEARFDMEIIERAVNDAQCLLISDVAASVTETVPDISIVSQVEPGDVLIDIRHPDEQTQRPLSVADDTGVAVLKLPFFQLQDYFADKDKNARYVLFCDQGMMSRLHAAHLEDQGFKQVAVYIPK